MGVMIGLEVHCQLNIESKLFCGDSSDHRGKGPNSCVCPICLGYPGSKPVINKKAIEHGMRIALALNCKIAEEMFFSRKTYFYPDMSKNYQITQYEIPLCSNGYLTVGELKVRIRRVHIEEDPARLQHVGGDITNAEYTLIDYNRSGVALAEIVTEPDFTTPKQARQFLDTLLSILEHLGVYDSEKEATIRCDANISLDGGERVEVKNITGFENVEKALNFEIIRQNGMKRMEVVVQRETRHFDADAGNTKSLRKKEYEEDYGYIFDPDLPTVKVTEDWLASIKKTQPELPDQRVLRFMKDYGIGEYDAHVLVYTDKNLADFYERCCKEYSKPDVVAKWTMNYLLKSLNWRGERINGSKVKVDSFVEFLGLIESGTITERFAKELIKEYVDTGESPAKLATKAATLSDSDLDVAVRKVLQENKKAADEFRSGKEDALKFLIGRALIATQKRADPNKLREMLLKHLNASIAQ